LLTFQRSAPEKRFEAPTAFVEAPQEEEVWEQVQEESEGVEEGGDETESDIDVDEEEEAEEEEEEQEEEDKGAATVHKLLFQGIDMELVGDLDEKAIIAAWKELVPTVVFNKDYRSHIANVLFWECAPVSDLQNLGQPPQQRKHQQRYQDRHRQHFFSISGKPTMKPH
jgi:hypothetical protein